MVRDNAEGDQFPFPRQRNGFLHPFLKGP
jgi:hypothetical protein